MSNQTKLVKNNKTKPIEIVRMTSETETYKVQSAVNEERYYIVKFVKGNPEFCTCKAFEFQSPKKKKKDGLQIVTY